MLKAYILVKDWVDTGHAVNSCTHAGYMMSLQWDKSDPTISEWLSDSFRKVTCKVSESQFEQAKKQADDWFVVTELAFDKQEVVLVFKPRQEWPNFFNFLSLYR